MERSGKAARQQAIREIIEGEEIRTQEELVTRLRERGLVVTQATVSRDLLEVGVVRVPGPDMGMIYALPYRRTQGQNEMARRRLPSVLADVAGEVAVAEAVIVYRTAPGNGVANMVAASIDACAFAEIVGTVAGDDTVFIAVRHARDRERVVALLQGGTFPTH